MQEFWIAPSLLAADFARLGAEVDAVVAAGADLVHFDVMDNHYVPNLTIGPVVCRALKNYGVKVPIDVHLMVKPVDRIIPEFAAAGASFITVHPEASEHLDRTLRLIIDHGARPGIALNPMTPLSCLDYCLEVVDLVLVMSINPGFGGQKFIPYTYEKIRAIRERIDRCGRPVRLEVDGGVKVHNIREIAESGADTFVAGTAIFKADDYGEVVAGMRRELARVVRPGSSARAR